MNFRAKIDKMLELFLVVVMSTLVVNVVWQVASRYIFSSPSSFTDELAGFLLIWVGLAGAAYVKGRNEHLAIDILHTKMGPKTHKRTMIFINFLIILFCISVMVIGGTWLMYVQFVNGQISAALQLPMGYVYMIVPFSGLLMTYYASDDIRHLIKELKSLK
ncbi:TRAP transporter small permease [Natronoflexus pectinivorans]|uniref:TRAP-type C4-dicarboxylate transport system permease small subunit n=1 Tax=Natronoflexus pectinivorans TaxID=682526 RepID=A0A4R2GIW0_9BACT|nr:TRAP transporter small permease [Natronoflexus pectinivorans]TCO07257.1 TRAP-type C4-dicarboxylate transport system permease small subunit [Natronoflexus pectinivorans]